MAKKLQGEKTAIEELLSDGNIKEPAAISLDASIDELFLTPRARNCLKAQSVHTISQLVELSEAMLFRTPNLGRKSLNEIKKELALRGRRLKPNN